MNQEDHHEPQTNVGVSVMTTNGKQKRGGEEEGWPEREGVRGPPFSPPQITTTTTPTDSRDGVRDCGSWPRQQQIPSLKVLDGLMTSMALTDDKLGGKKFGGCVQKSPRDNAVYSFG